MKVEEICNKIMSDIPKSVAAGAIDMQSGLLLDVKTADSHPTQLLDMLAAITKDYFEGEMVTQVENTFKRNRGKDADRSRYFKEIIINSTNLIHVFVRVPTNENTVLAVVCRSSANLGLCLSKLRLIAENVRFL